ncbi:MAG: chromosome partitioning protein ParB, partial [Syntrophales bacterium]
DDFGLCNVIAHKVAISGVDVREHRLPSDMEAKVSSPNYKKFVARHGVHVAELDAAPVDLLQKKLRDTIESCLDMEIFHAGLAKEKEDYAFIAATKQMVVKAMGGESHG